MGRAKLPIRLINPERSRHTTFTKRKKGLKKKIFEFATLCDVDACMIICGPTTTETWPEDPTKVRQVIERFREASAEERNKRQVDISGFLSSKNKKLQGELERKRAENAELVSLLLSNRTSLEAMDLDTVLELQQRLHAKVDAVNEWMESLRRNDLENQGSQSEMPISWESSQQDRSSPLLQYNISSLIVPPPQSLPQGWNGSDLSVAHSGQGKSPLDPFLFGPVPDYSNNTVDPVLDHYGYADLISGFLPGSYDSLPFSFPVTEDLDPLTGLLYNSDPIQESEDQGYIDTMEEPFLWLDCFNHFEEFRWKWIFH
ncbi:unnamed protein product [Victoria cruziana]